MGSGEQLEIFTEILNRGEDAYNARLEVQLPPGQSGALLLVGFVEILCSDWLRS